MGQRCALGRKVIPEEKIWTWVTLMISGDVFEQNKTKIQRQFKRVTSELSEKNKKKTT